MADDNEHSAELRAFLETTKASDVETPHKEVVEVKVSMTPVEAAKELWSHKVIGAPVYDEERKKYIGFFDMRDLLSTVIASHKEEEASKKSDNKSGSKDFAFTKWFDKSPSTAGSGSFTVSYLAARNPFVSLTNDATLMEVCKICADRHCHRVPIIDKSTGRCVRILSQSALVKFLVDHLLAESKSATLKKFFDQTLAQANFPYKKEVKTAPDTATASEVFELMDSHRLSGIAVVDHEDGALVGNTSATDIKLAVAVDDGAFADLGLNVLSFLSAVRQEDPTKETRYPSSHVKESSTLAHTFKLLAKTGYHRVFVVDMELKPVGVVSVTDVVEFLAKQ
ncbi:Protein SDS23 [Seminavis robusta]|uniref:Protein SDS23 n=1 Tax=Seminavis robusta TaxID=568900 RepID=A0A9N8EMR2_9STRA|nr:Protein SDS23 [Seminavis robusta]|eukprot:Sro1561_g282590.1 Protein SDS23 (338) ;mRNA; f:8444-9550